jgi:hypothetical protein
MYRVRVYVPGIALCLAAVAGTTLAAPEPGSLRADRVGAVVRLSWDAPPGFCSVYRSADPADVLRPAWLRSVQQETTYDDPIKVGDPDVLFYLVDDFIPCVGNADCDDFDLCNGTEQCGGAQTCEAGPPVVCTDNDACTVDACDPATGTCANPGVDCDDLDPCTLDSCHPVTGCDHVVDPLAAVGVPAQLAGRALGEFPFFEFVSAVNAGDGVQLGVDPAAHPGLIGETCDAYIIEARPASSWCADLTLTDVRGAPDTIAIVDGTIQDNTFTLAGSGTLSGDAGTAIGAGYDLVLDCNRNGALDADEPVDGLEDEAGFYVFRDLAAPGPLTVVTFDSIGPEPPHCNAGGNDDMRIYYPDPLDDPGFAGTFPLVVVSHGNGHCFDWYDFLGTHLASYGYIVMSHDNDTMPGIETASETTLVFTDRILNEQSTLGGGVLAGHIDSSRIAWIGHSRGGEGIVRAYDRLIDEAYPSSAFTADDLVVLSSIAPTDFLGPAQSDPKGVAYHLLYGSSDGDVCGCPNSAVAQSFLLFERATGARQSTYVHGADHNDFNCCGFDDFTGPAGTAIGRPEAQQVQKASTLALLKLYVDRQVAPRDWFWRQYETLRPLGVAGSTTVVHDLRAHPLSRGFTIDDFQTEPDPGTSSSGGAVSTDLSSYVEDQQTDLDSSFEWTGNQPMNGMTRGRANDLARGSVFDYNGAGGDAFLEFDVVPGGRDFSDATYLSFRAAQGTRHPDTAAALQDLTFTVTLIDGSGGRSSIAIGAYGGGIEEPYQRGGFGVGAGWQNEFEVIRIRLDDFARNGTSIDLSDVRAVRFEFGPSFGSADGRVGIDTIELVKE